MTRKKLTRSIVLQWLIEQPGMSNQDIADRTGQERCYVAEKMRGFELRGLVRRKMRPSKVGPYEILWFFNEKHQIEEAKKQLAHAAKVERINRKHEEKAQASVPDVVQRVCKAPAVDRGIVRRAVRSSSPLEAAWRGGL